MIDTASLKLSLATILGTIFSITTKSDIVFFITCLVGITTIVYNGIKIYKEVKR
jgi:hypothetical protein